MRAMALLLPGALMSAAALAQDTPSATRQHELVRMVRQDCGSCHGMRLTGGLGPALTRDVLAERSPKSVAATIFHGRPGSPMPPWRSMLSESEAAWIAEQLIAGFPTEGQGAR